MCALISMTLLALFTRHSLLARIVPSYPRTSLEAVRRGGSQVEEDTDGKIGAGCTDVVRRVSLVYPLVSRVTAQSVAHCVVSAPRKSP